MMGIPLSTTSGPACHSHSFVPAARLGPIHIDENLSVPLSITSTTHPAWSAWRRAGGFPNGRFPDEQRIHRKRLALAFRGGRCLHHFVIGNEHPFQAGVAPLRPGSCRAGRGIFLLGLVWLLAPVVDANPFARIPPRAKTADIPGDSQVPGFPTTPGRLTQGYFNAFMQAEADAPSEDRMLHAFKHPDMGPVIVTFLPRYFSPRLVEPTRRLARSPDPAVQAGAISGLISLWDSEPSTRVFIRGLLRAGNPAVRGRAAEYLCWCGIPEDYPFLTKSAAVERDVHARAAMVEAAAAIKRRAAVFGAGDAAALTAGGSPAATYQCLAEVLAANPTGATRQAVIARLRGIEGFEPVTRFNDRLDHGERGSALLGLHRLVAGYPESAAVPADSRQDLPTTLPATRTLVPPVRDYFDANRKSYGILIKTEAGNPFSGKYHVGDDAAWQKDHETVVAIGDGIVRQVDLGRKSWGGLVIVEHADAAGGRFCSLYGHLGPLVCVHPGQAVRQGQKLGVVGISYSHANGGYLSHLHFGIHRSAFLLPDRVGAKVELPGLPGETLPATVTAVHEETVDARFADGQVRPVARRANWTGGYLQPDEFNSKGHAWVDPQGFIQRFKGSID